MKYETAVQPLRSRRRALRLTVEDVAVKAAISVPHLYNLENGRCSPGLEVARRVADALSANVDDIFPKAQADGQAAAA